MAATKRKLEEDELNHAKRTKLLQSFDIHDDDLLRSTIAECEIVADEPTPSASLLNQFVLVFDDHVLKDAMEYLTLFKDPDLKFHCQVQEFDKQSYLVIKTKNMAQTYQIECRIECTFQEVVEKNGELHMYDTKAVETTDAPTWKEVSVPFQLNPSIKTNFCAASNGIVKLLFQIDKLTLIWGDEFENLNEMPIATDMVERFDATPCAMHSERVLIPVRNLCNFFKQADTTNASLVKISVYKDADNYGMHLQDEVKSGEADFRRPNSYMLSPIVKRETTEVVKAVAAKQNAKAFCKDSSRLVYNRIFAKKLLSDLSKCKHQTLTFFLDMDNPLMVQFSTGHVNVSILLTPHLESQ